MGTHPPVFLCMGGEGASGRQGCSAYPGQEYHGLAFSIEHRYYGQASPEDFSTPNLRWLGTNRLWQMLPLRSPMNEPTLDKFTVDQLRRQLLGSSPLGSYQVSSPHTWYVLAGVVASSKVFSPHPRCIPTGAVASSAPVSAIVDFDGYDPIVADALAYPLVGGSVQCREAVASAFAALEHKFDHQRPRLQQIFNTCGEVKTDGDVYLLHDSDTW